MKPVEQVIFSLSNEPEKWTQGDCTLAHKNGVRIWTANMPYLDCRICSPPRKTGLFDRIRLQLAVNRWHKLPLIMKSN